MAAEREGARAGEDLLALRASEILESMSDAFITLDRDWRYVYLNGKAERLIGHQRAEILGHRVEDIFPGTEHGSFYNQARAAVASGQERIFEDFSPLLGRWFQVRCYPGVDSVSFYYTDITERRQAEQALQESERRYRDLFENANEIHYTLDLSGALLDLNRRGEQLTGYAREELLGKPITALLAPESGTLMREVLGRKVAGEPVTTYELPIRARDGRQLLLEISSRLFYRDGQPAGIHGIARDISDRRRTEQALRESEARLRRLFEANLIGIIFWTLAGEVLDANDAFLQMSGYERVDLAAGRIDWRTMTPPEYRPLDEQAVAALRARGEHSPYEKEYLRKDGSRLPIMIGSALFEGQDNPEGQRDRGVSFILDISERRRAEQARESFLASVTHDLRTPLTAIRGTAQLLERRLRRGRVVDPEQALVSLEAIESASMRMAEMVNDLLDLARMQSGRPLNLTLASCDMAVVTRRCVDDIARISSSHRLQIEVAPEPVIGEWDATRLQRVLHNLLTNAVKYSPPGSAITVRVCREPLPDGAQAVVSVSDEGLGIPVADLPYVFDWFRRGANVEGRTEGVGIGLAGARQIVEQHGGSIEVLSSEGRGSTFTVRLPIH